MTGPGRPTGGRMFTDDQIRNWRVRHSYARRIARENTVQAMADEAGVSISAMRQILGGQVYKWVR